MVKRGLLRQQSLNVYSLLCAGPMSGVEGLVERRHDDQRQQGRESHTADDHPCHTGPELSTGALREGNGEHTDDGREGSHQDRARTELDRLYQCLVHRQPPRRVLRWRSRP